MLESWLDFHRVTLLLKCEGLSDEQRKRRSVESSLMSLHGLVRHMAEVEQGWFQRCLARRYREVKPHFCTKDHPDGDFEFAGEGDWESDLSTGPSATNEPRPENERITRAAKARAPRA